MADEREDGLGRRRGEVLGDRLRVGGLPPLDLVDQHQAAARGEQPHRIAGRDRVVTAGLSRREPLDRVVGEPLAEAVERAVDLRAVAARQQVGRFQRIGHHWAT